MWASGAAWAGPLVAAGTLTVALEPSDRCGVSAAVSRVGADALAGRVPVVAGRTGATVGGLIEADGTRGARCAGPAVAAGAAAACVGVPGDRRGVVRAVRRHRACQVATRVAVVAGRTAGAVGGARIVRRA